MKVKVISDGTSAGTKVIDEASGAPLDGVVSITWELQDDPPLVLCYLTLRNVPVAVHAHEPHTSWFERKSSL